MSTATDMLQAYLDAEAAIVGLHGFQTYRWIDGRQMTRADLPEIQRGRREWERKVNLELRNAAKAPTFGGLGISTARLDGL